MYAPNPTPLLHVRLANALHHQAPPRHGGVVAVQAEGVETKVTNCSMPRCDQPAEIRWTMPAVNGFTEDKRVHELCGACMASLWSEINLKYPESMVQQASTFEPLND